MLTFHIVQVSLHYSHQTIHSSTHIHIQIIIHLWKMNHIHRIIHSTIHHPNYLFDFHLPSKPFDYPPSSTIQTNHLTIHHYLPSKLFIRLPTIQTIHSTIHQISTQHHLIISNIIIQSFVESTSSSPHLSTDIQSSNFNHQTSTS